MPKDSYWRLSCFYFFYFSFIGAMAPYWGLYLKSLGFAAFEIGVLMSLLQVMRIFAPNLCGHIADRSGRRAAIVQTAALICLIAYLGVFFGQSFWWMFAVMSLISFFWSAPLPLVEAITLTHLGERTDRYGRIRLWGSVGFILVVLGLGTALDHYPVKLIPWVVLGLLIGIWLSSWLLPEAILAQAEHEHTPLGKVLRRPQVWALLAAATLMIAAHGPYFTFFTIHLIEAGYSKTVAGWMWSLGVICEIGIFLALPRVLGHVRVETVLLLTLAAAALRFLIIAWWVDSLSWLLIAQALHALSFGAYHASAMSLVHRHFRGRVQARGQALYNSLAFGVGGTFGSLYAGATWDTLGAAWSFSLAAALAALAAAVFAWRGWRVPASLNRRTAAASAK